MNDRSIKITFGLIYSLDRIHIKPSKFLNYMNFKIIIIFTFGVLTLLKFNVTTFPSVICRLTSKVKDLLLT